MEPPATERPDPVSYRILGLGIDVIDLGRIKSILDRHETRFIARLCRPGECKDRRGSALVEHVGGLFAAKEAVLKALGTGWAQGLSFRQVEVTSTLSGSPEIVLHEQALARAKGLSVDAIHLSISHERSYAVAIAVLEGDPS